MRCYILGQNELKEHIPEKLQNDFLRLHIDSEERLSKEKIKFVVETALEATILVHLGFGIQHKIRGDNRFESLEIALKKLENLKISFISEFAGKGTIGYPLKSH